MVGFLQSIYNGITEVISGSIAEKSKDNEDRIAYITSIVKEFEGSDTRKTMSIAQLYYENKTDISDAKRMVIGRDPDTDEAVLMESKVLSNNKLAHNYMKKLTRQKIGYMLSKPFTFSSVKADDELAKNMFEDMSNYFDEDFLKMLKNVGRDSIVKGIGWILVYYNEAGKLKFKRIAPEEVVPVWADNDHTVLDAVVRKYRIKSFERGKSKETDYVDYYTREGIYNYQYNSNGVLTALNDGNPVAHFSRRVPGNDGVVEGVNWANIPFVPFKYDPDEQSLITRVKTLVDDYDKKTSNFSNQIDDFPNSMTVVKNFDGTSKEEFVHNKNQYRTLFVGGDGDARSLETPLDADSFEKHLERLRQDIYEFGQGVDTANKDIRDTSGVALRFLYADLDADCLDWGGEVRWSIKKLIWFVQQDIIAKGGKDYQDVKYDVIFNTDVIINETETIQNCFTSKGVISDRTIAENHPWVKSADKEIDGMMEGMEEELKLEQEYGNKTKDSTTGQRAASTSK